MNIYPSVECAGGHIIKDTLEELVTGAIRNGMVHIYEIIDMLKFIGKVEAVRMALRTLPSKIMVSAVTNQAAVKCDII
jgi:hypothetical protein